MVITEVFCAWRSPVTVMEGVYWCSALGTALLLSWTVNTEVFCAWYSAVTVTHGEY